jgi:hypothetical protein
MCHRTHWVLAYKSRVICSGKYMPKLSWKLLTKKRGSSAQGLPPGKESGARADRRSVAAIKTRPIAKGGIL